MRCGGYAWLDASGKIAPQLIPTFAITNVFTIDQSVLKAYPAEQLNIQNETDNIFLRLKWWKNHEGASIDALIGDIIVVVPGQDATGKAIAPDPFYCGAYIVKDVPREGSDADYEFVKLSYEAGKIVSINGVVPDGTNGLLNLYLSDILKEKATRDDTDNSYASKLAKTLWNFSTVSPDLDSDLFNNGERFGFKVDDKIQTYVLTNEFSAEHDKRVAKEDEILATLASTSGALSTAISYVSGEAQGLRDDLGTQNDAPKYAATDTVYSQVFGLRAIVDKNAELLDTAIAGTNADVNKLQASLDYLGQQLGGKAIELSSKTFNFSAVTPGAMAVPP